MEVLSIGLAWSMRSGNGYCWWLLLVHHPSLSTDKELYPLTR